MARLGLWRAVALVLASAAGAAHADVTISSKPTSNIVCAAGVCTPTAKKAVLNADELAAMLASGDVTVNTAGSLASSITVSASLSWTSTSRLTLDAYQSVTVTKPVSVTGTGAMTITTNDGGTDGDLTFDGKGRVIFWDMSSSLVINGQSFTLVNSLKALKDAASANPNGAYALADNYNAKRNGVLKRAPIKEFHGTLEGLGNAISNLTMNDGAMHNPLPTALVGKNLGTLRDLGLTKVDIQRGAAALADFNYGTIRNCYAIGSVFGIGGLVAVNQEGAVVSHSHVDVVLTGGGGLVGTNDGTVDSSYAAGTGAEAGGGGLVNINHGTISRSFATINSLGTEHMGGLAAFNGPPGPALIEDSYATGAVKGRVTGGLIGQNAGGLVRSSYAIGTVDGDPAGGLIGEDDAPGGVSDSYWDLDTSGISDPHQGAGTSTDDPGITGLTSEQFKSGLPNGFDPMIWAQKSGINGGYPYLKVAPPR